MAKLEFSHIALADLVETVAYIADDNPVAAQAWNDNMREVCAALAATPEMGRSRPELGENIRSFPTGRYVIFYQAGGSGVFIVRILHGALDVDEDTVSG